MSWPREICIMAHRSRQWPRRLVCKLAACPSAQWGLQLVAAMSSSWLREWPIMQIGPPNTRPLEDTSAGQPAATDRADTCGPLAQLAGCDAWLRWLNICPETSLGPRASVWGNSTVVAAGKTLQARGVEGYQRRRRLSERRSSPR